MHHAAIAGCDAGPLMHGTFEHFGAADEIADMPIGQRDLAAERRGVEHPDTAALDQPDTVMLATLAEQRLATVEHFSAALLQHQLPLALAELVHQRRRSADPLLVLGEQQRGTAGRPDCRGTGPPNRIRRRLQHYLPPERSNRSKEEQCPCQIHSAVIVRLDRAIQYSRDVNGLSRSRGVLDSPPSRGMTAEFGGRPVASTVPPGSANTASGKSPDCAHPKKRCSARNRDRRSR